MTHTAPSVNGSSRSAGGRFTNQVAELEELVTEIQARIDEQLADHTDESRAIHTEVGRDAVEDTAFARAIANARHQVDHGTRGQQLDAVARVAAVHLRDEAAEESFLAALLGALGVHNIAAHDLRRLVHRNVGALTAGAPVELDEPLPIPAPLIERQQAVRA
ncbi:MAG TPA: hypothetical protein VEW95_09365 [Candidatus Limnocylindrales bacterium]|nr:hypothetical protein [Candidatus Limnocylindrales bacterium]